MTIRCEPLTCLRAEVQLKEQLYHRFHAYEKPTTQTVSNKSKMKLGWNYHA